MTSSSRTIETNRLCWQARDNWWKCLDLYDDCQMKCQKQIEQLYQACSPQMVGMILE